MVTLCTTIALLVVAVLEVPFADRHGLTVWTWGSWGWADTGYLAMMALLSASLLVHAGQDGDAILPRTIAVVAAILSVPAGFVALIFMLVSLEGLDFSDPGWLAASAYSELVVSLLPFATAFVAGLLMRLLDHRSPRFRVSLVVVLVGVSAIILALAVWIPRLLQEAEKAVN